MARWQTAAIILIAIWMGFLAYLVGRLFAPPPPDPDTIATLAPADCSAQPLLSFSDFSGSGSWDTVNPPAPQGVQSTFDGTIVLANADRNIVEDVLPTGWSLAQPNSAQLCHPILVLYGRHRDFAVFFAAPLWPDVTLSMAKGTATTAYDEMMVLIPFVQRASVGKKMHTFVTRMYLEDATAQQYGNEYYGYAKLLAAFDKATTNVFTVLPNPMLPVWTARTSNFGTQQTFGSATISATIPDLPKIQEILAMPLVGEIWDDFFKKWKDQCSYFELDYSKPARFRSVTVEQQYMKSFATGTILWPSLGVLKSPPNGAVQIEDVVWRLRFLPSICVYQP